MCSTPGTYRFVVSGVSGAGGYSITSNTFAVGAGPTPVVGPVTVAGNVASFRATYADTPSSPVALRMRPRLAGGGSAKVLVRTPGQASREVTAVWSPTTYRYEAAGPFGAGTTAEVVAGSLAPGCVNPLNVAGSVVDAPVAAPAAAPSSTPLLPTTGATTPWVVAARLCGHRGAGRVAPPARVTPTPTV